MWLYVGIKTENSWIRPNDKLLKGEATVIDELGKFEDNLPGYFLYALWFLLTIFTTVGYGNDYSQTNTEHTFLIFMEFGSFIVQGCLIIGL